jgi:3-oxoacyl-[acyl-carrier-protein] synthase-3
MPEELLGPFVFGTDGRGADNLIVRVGGMRQRHSQNDAEPETDADGNVRSSSNLYMNGSEIFVFTLRVVPECVSDLLMRAGKNLDDIDLFVFHQANQYMLEHLRKKIGIPPEKFCIAMRDCGNTVSSTIPVALKRSEEEGRLREGQLVMLVGFGVGYSWGANLVRWCPRSNTL